MADRTQAGIFEGLGSGKRGSYEKNNKTLYLYKPLFNYSIFSDNSIIVYLTN